MWNEVKAGNMPEDYKNNDNMATDLVVAYNESEEDAVTTFRLNGGDEWIWDDEQHGNDFKGYTHWRWLE